MRADTFQRGFVLLLAVAVTAVFAGMVRAFLVTLLLAGITAGLLAGPHCRLAGKLGDRPRLAAGVTTLLLLLVVLLPLLGLLGLVAAEAVSVGGKALPWVREQLTHPDALARWLEQSPWAARLAPYRELLLTKAGETVGAVSSFLLASLTATTRGTVNLLFQAFIFLYAVYYFLVGGRSLLDRLLFYLPLHDADERRLLERFLSVSRATLKGTLLIGLLQGSLAGVALAVAGIGNALFWGAVMVLLSVIPGIGTGLVWIPAAIILVAGGHTARGVGLALFCALVVGSIDNVIRPRLVGRDTRLHDLLILVSTLGGLAMFGVVGFLVGPLLAALLVSVWDIYGATFRDVLPRVGGS